MWIYTGNKFAKFHGYILSLSENIAKSFRGATFLTHTVGLYLFSHMPVIPVEIFITITLIFFHSFILSIHVKYLPVPQILPTARLLQLFYNVYEFVLLTIFAFYFLSLSLFILMS